MAKFAICVRQEENEKRMGREQDENGRRMRRELEECGKRMGKNEKRMGREWEENEKRMGREWEENEKRMRDLLNSAKELIIYYHYCYYLWEFSGRTDQVNHYFNLSIS